MRKGQKGIKIKFCKRGHEIAICGRRTNGACQGCYTEQRNGKKPGVEPSNICGKGHDKNKTGKYSDNECMECTREHNKEYYNQHKEAEAARIKKWREENEEQIKQYTLVYRRLNKELCLERTRRWRIEHPDTAYAHDLRCQTQRNLRIVAWTDWDKIAKIIKKCPKNKEIDHIIPLRGKKVSGLHVSWNLQYLTPLKNQKKGNRIDLVKVSEDYGKLLKKLGLK